MTKKLTSAYCKRQANESDFKACRYMDELNELNTIENPEELGGRTDWRDIHNRQARLNANIDFYREQESNWLAKANRAKKLL